MKEALPEAEKDAELMDKESVSLASWDHEGSVMDSDGRRLAAAAGARVGTSMGGSVTSCALTKNDVIDDVPVVGSNEAHQHAAKQAIHITDLAGREKDALRIT